MKPDPKLRKALLTDKEIKVLLDYYDVMITDGSKILASLKNSPVEELVAEQFKKISTRRDAIARYSDGRWTNKGTGRRKKETVSSPALPLDAPKTETVSKENRPF